MNIDRYTKIILTVIAFILALNIFFNNRYTIVGAGEGYGYKLDGLTGKVYFLITTTESEVKRFELKDTKKLPKKIPFKIIKEGDAIPKKKDTTKK